MHLNWLFHVSSAKGVILITPGVGPASSGRRQGSVFRTSPCSCYLTPSDPAPWCPSGPHLLLACLCPAPPRLQEQDPGDCHRVPGLHRLLPVLLPWHAQHLQLHAHSVRGCELWASGGPAGHRPGGSLDLAISPVPSGTSGGWSPCPLACSSLSMMRSGNLESAVAQEVSVEPGGLGMEG